MMRKLLIVAMVPTLAMAGCANQSLRRMEVWKQRTFFRPSDMVVVQPGVQAGYQAAPYQMAPGEVVGPELPFESAGGTPMTVEYPSAEEVHGVLEQP